MGYYVGDIPGQPLVIDPERNDEPVDLSYFDTIATTLYDPAGDIVELDFEATIEENDTITIDWPDTSPFTTAGIYRLRLIGEAAGVREVLPVVRLVADELDNGWYTLEEAREEWRDAPSYDARLYSLLGSAKLSVLKFAPALEDGQRVPGHYMAAQLMQARNKWNSDQVAPSGESGEGDFVMRPYPLDWQIQETLRPRGPIQGGALA
jgi:hypothetical protein